MTVKERFLSYVSFDTRSDSLSDACPSTEKQWALARHLAAQLREMGAENVRLDENCYLMAEIPSNMGDGLPALGFIAHMDTSPDAPGENVRPRLIPDYDGERIALSEDKGLFLDPAEFKELPGLKGKELIVTDGSTLLGADDKAGIAEIMCLAERLLRDRDIPHGKVCIGFTPDEEIGRGADRFDVAAFGADFAYTVDGGALGEIEYENFNAANGNVFIRGRGIHPGSAKDKMINAALVAAEFASLLPQWETPSHTEGYEGFYHLSYMEGDVSTARLQYRVRDHDRVKFEKRKKVLLDTAEFLNRRYGDGVVSVRIDDSYYNMKEMILPHMELIRLAEKAMESLGVKPEVLPIRGGTDGARLSYMGLPCPNLCTGGYAFHGPYEHIAVEDMEKIVEILKELTRLFFMEKSAANG